jgi:transposase
VEDLVNSVDPSLLEAAYSGVGSHAYRPILMLKIVMWEYLEGRTSPAQWARDARENDVVRWLGRGIKPSRTTCYSFRDRMGKVILPVHMNMINQAMDEELLSAETGVQDGTTLRACASRHRVVNLQTLTRRCEALQATIDKDAAGDSVVPSAGWMASSCVGRSGQGKRYSEAKQEVTRRLAENAKKPKDKRLPEKKVMVSTSDPQAPLGRDKEKVFCPLYTAQFVVDPTSLLVISWDVFAQATDTGTLSPLIDLTQQIVGGKLRSIIADASYATLLDLQSCERRGIELFAPVQENNFTEKKRARKNKTSIDREQFTWMPEQRTYICPQGHWLDYKGKERRRRRGDAYVTQHRFQCPGQHCQRCPLRRQCVRNPNRGRIIKRLEGQEILDAHQEKMKTPRAQEYRKLRGQVVERPFADAKAHRNFRQLHGRGLYRARAETGLLVLAQNALTLRRLRRSRANPGYDTS